MAGHAEEASGRQTLTFFTHQALAAAAQVKRLVEAGFLGRPLRVDARYFSASHLQPDKPAASRPGGPRPGPAPSGTSVPTSSPGPVVAG